MFAVTVWQVVGWSAAVAVGLVVAIGICAVRVAGQSLRDADEDYRG